MDPTELSNIVRLGRRVARPASMPVEDVASIYAMLDAREGTPALEPRSTSTSTSSSSASASVDCTANPNLCEHDVSELTFKLPIILGIVIPVVGASIAFFILHRRHVRKQREEDANDRTASMDFGLDIRPKPGRKGPALGTGLNPVAMEEKNGRKQRQQSMDMGLESPYLLPPELGGSRESLHSLSRTIHQNEDPYRPVSQFLGSDNGSIHSYGNKGRNGSSIYTASSKAPSRLAELKPGDRSSSHEGPPRAPGLFIPPPRQNSLGGSSYGSPADKNSPAERSPYLTPVDGPPKNPFGSPVETIDEADKSSSPPYPIEPAQAHLPTSTSPPTVARKGLPTITIPDGPDTRESYQSNTYLGSLIHSREPSPAPQSPVSQSPKDNRRKSPPSPISTQPMNPRVASLAASTHRASVESDGSDYGDGFKITPPSPDRETVPRSEELRGKRYSMDVAPEEFAKAGLGAPGFDPKRLSMGFRPLPPDGDHDTEDPEMRANRIRSFYKEYFDESKPAPQGQYIEDYDGNYMGKEAAYYDPDSNAFVMPYAEPVTRRAMTPPPQRGPRFQGPRPRNGSMGAAQIQGRGPAQMYPPSRSPGPRSYSSASGAFSPPGNRSFSSASGAYSPSSAGRRTPNGSKKPIVPPSPLNTLPTPSKLRDDSFALNFSDEFAPPPSVRDRVNGRSDSPVGERRPYSPAVPSFTPTVSSFEDLAPMPSPHLLRKSGTFTGLDFAPPKRIRTDDMSDAGSIRSTRSGVSAMQHDAIRKGAYRVSRVQKDIVFTKDDMADELKPQWGLR